MDEVQQFQENNSTKQPAVNYGLYHIDTITYIRL